jgi:hypothetical protein
MKGLPIYLNAIADPPNYFLKLACNVDGLDLFDEISVIPR